MRLRPMLAAKTPEDLSVFKPHYPLLASPKLDGIRCLIVNGVAVSRTLKPIPSQWVQQALSKPEFEGLDGELISGEPQQPDVYRETVSAVMAYLPRNPEVTFYVFDRWNVRQPYMERMLPLFNAPQASPPVACLPQTWIDTEEQLVAYEQQMLAEGYEGAILRNPLTYYKFGRSTVREGALVKLKRTHDAEARILGFVELLHNDNEATLDARGYTKRSTHASGKRPGDMLGALIVENLSDGKQFQIGSGFTQADRISLWKNQASYIGQVVKYRYLPYGVKDLPRHPVFLGFRSELDI